MLIQMCLHCLNGDSSLDMCSAPMSVTTVQHTVCICRYQDLKIIGHSLGAGTAALLAMMLHNDTGAATRWGNPQISCVGFATPPVVCEENALRCRDYITTVVCQVVALQPHTHRLLAAATTCCHALQAEL